MHGRPSAHDKQAVSTASSPSVIFSTRCCKRSTSVTNKSRKRFKRSRSRCNNERRDDNWRQARNVYDKHGLDKLKENGERLITQ
uniref:Uncharacterized protein n=1 Tax=Romanomermis culicivorax TaxID=13658 RepID=A0A915J7I3_ROMCU